MLKSLKVLTDGMRLLGPVEDAENLIIIDAINAGKLRVAPSFHFLVMKFRLILE